MSLTAKPYDNENIYDLTIRLYGNINGLSGLINNVTTLDDAVDSDVIYNEVVFNDYVEKSTPEEKRETIVVKVGEDQTIYDLALQLTGKLDGIASIINNYEGLDDDLQGTEITITKNDDPLLEVFLNNNLVLATRDKDVVVSNWILALGVWNDLGVWIDGENWID